MIYFIEAPDCKKIKIGYSRNDPDKRLSSLQTGSPLVLKRLALMHGDKNTEFQIHSDFMDFWSHGEWFFDNPLLRKFIDENAKPWAAPTCLVPQIDPPKPELSDAEKSHHAYLLSAVNRVRPSSTIPVEQPRPGNSGWGILRAAREARKAK